MLHILTPSRGRPANALRLRDALRETCAGEWRLWLGVDSDDPALDEYRALAGRDTFVRSEGRMHLSAWTNYLADLASDDLRDDDWLASLGDDHLPRTPGWAYGNDLLQGEGIPTAWVQHADLVRGRGMSPGLGWMMLPACEHLGVDLAVRDLGRAAGRIAYEPAVVVEHLHFVNGKAADDATYRHGNNETRIRDDNAAHAAWLASPQFAADVQTVKALTWGGGHG